MDVEQEVVVYPCYCVRKMRIIVKSVVQRYTMELVWFWTKSQELGPDSNSLSSMVSLSNSLAHQCDVRLSHALQCTRRWGSTFIDTLCLGRGGGVMLPWVRIIFMCPYQQQNDTIGTRQSAASAATSSYIVQHRTQLKDGIVMMMEARWQRQWWTRHATAQSTTRRDVSSVEIDIWSGGTLQHHTPTCHLQERGGREEKMAASFSSDA